MAHFSNAVPVHSPMQDFAFLWGMSGSKDKMRLQWEPPFLSAPVAAPLAKETVPQLPDWMTTTDEEVPAPSIGKHGPKEVDGKEHLVHLRESLHSASTPFAVSEALEQFNRDFNQRLYLGQVTEDVLSASISRVCNDIRKHSIDESFKEDAYMAFFQALWDGITASRVLRPTELRADMLRPLITTLPQVSVQKSAALLSRVLVSMTDSQTQQLMPEICAISNTSFRSPAIPSGNEKMSAASTSQSGLSVCDSTAAFDFKATAQFVESLSAVLERYPPEKAREHLRNLARLSAAYVAQSILRMYSSPFQDTAGEKSAGSRRQVIGRANLLRKTWLELVARMPYTSENILVEVFHIMDAHVRGNGCEMMPRVSIHDLCDVLLEYWISKDSDAESMTKARAYFRAAASKHGRRGVADSIVHLCRALELHSRRWRLKAQCALGMIRRVRGVGSSYACLIRLEDAQVYLPSTILRDEMKWLSRCNLKQARTLFTKCMAERPPTASLSLEAFPELAVAVIHDPTCNAAEVWLALGGRKMWTEDQISDARIDLVQRMAYEFSQAKGITSREALRNVDKCYRYLSYHQIPMGRDFARIMTHVGLERHIREKGSISEGRLQWILGIVAQSQGRRVAKMVEAVVLHRKRGPNPFKIGPID